MAKKKKTLPWERQKGETTNAYEAFCVYRDLGVKRSQVKTCEKLGKNSTTISDWSVKYNWVERAAAYDDDQERKEREMMEKERLNDIKKMRDRHADLAVSMLEKAARAMQAIPDVEVKASDITRMVDVASKLERISRGDVGDVIEERNGGEAIPAVQFYMPDNGRDGSEEEGEE